MSASNSVVVALVIWAAAVDPADQISLGHIQPGIEQAGDDADQPCVACRSATTEDQRSLTRGAHPPGGVDLRLILVGPRPVGGRRRGEVQS
jgi:hypothetical protein